MRPSRHEGCVAVVSGAGYGIGRATASRFAREGAAVIGFDVSDEGLAAASAEFEPAGISVSLENVDVTDQAAVDRLVAGVLGRHDPIDVLANLAGIMDWFLPAHEVDDASDLESLRDDRARRLVLHHDFVSAGGPGLTSGRIPFGRFGPSRT